jgi:hypothetical protein
MPPTTSKRRDPGRRASDADGRRRSQPGRGRRSFFHPPSEAFARDALDARAILREVGDVDQCEPVGAVVGPCDDKGGDFNQLSMTTRGCAAVLTRRFQMLFGVPWVSGDARENGEKCVFDRVHAPTVHSRAYSPLTHD